MSVRLRIVVISSAGFGFRQPFAGGLESHTWDLASGLRRLGHHVTVLAGPGTDESLGARSMITSPLQFSTAARQDVSMLPEEVLQEHIAYQRAMLRLMHDREVDVVHVNCVHQLPIAMAPLLPSAVTATLHCPPTPWLELAYASAREDGAAPRAAAVSAHLARAWKQATGWEPGVIGNGVDLEAWSPGPGDGGYVIWSGRLVPEKAPHLAIEAARLAGVPLVLAGPSHDRAYFAERIAPHLGEQVHYAGHLRQPGLAVLAGRASAALVTPAWEEPFGLVAAEAMACGTPVAAIARGALPDLVDDSVGALSGQDPADLAGALLRAMRRDRSAVRAHAEQRFDVEVMVRGYEQMMLQAVEQQAAKLGASEAAVA